MYNQPYKSAVAARILQFSQLEKQKQVHITSLIHLQMLLLSYNFYNEKYTFYKQKNENSIYM